MPVMRPYYRLTVAQLLERFDNLSQAKATGVQITSVGRADTNESGQRNNSIDMELEEVVHELTYKDPGGNWHLLLVDNKFRERITCSA